MTDEYTVGAAAEMTGVSVRSHQPEFAQRQERTARYTEQDWLRLRDELHAIHRHLVEAMRRGVPATDPAVMDLAEQLRRHTDHWFHDCGYDKHRELAVLYRDNQRSGRNYDDMAPGLSRYVYDAIMANCDRATQPEPEAARRRGR